MAGMTTDDPAAGLTRLDALITPDLWSHVDGANRSARVGWGTMLNVAHLVRGIRTLHAAGQCHAAVPLLRSAIEYTAGTIWLADAGEDAVDVLNRGLQYSHGKLLKHLGGIGVDLDASFPAEAVQVFRDTMAVQLSPHPDEWLIRFSRLLAEYGFDKVIPVYDVLSGLTHLSLLGAQEFFQAKDDGTHLSLHPLFPSRRRGTRPGASGSRGGAGRSCRSQRMIRCLVRGCARRAARRPVPSPGFAGSR